ncbi:MAG: N-acetylmuramoyl-L-alanine amidase [Clostridiales bacterium]|nr:N-acetylmuramoyl-L-alanine amidase [Clostridiales bacterium]
MKRKNTKNKFKVKNIKRIMIISFAILISCSFLAGYLYYKKNGEIKYLDNMGLGKYDISGLKDEVQEMEESLDVKRIDFNFGNTLEETNNPKKIIFHHTASAQISPELLNEIHKSKGWEGIGYHYYIRKDGTIFSGRPEKAVGAHAYGNNKDTIGICLEGDFEIEKPNEKQLSSLVNLSTYIIIKYNIETIVGHKDLCNTLCPGKNFPMEDVNNNIADNIKNKLKE